MRQRHIEKQRQRAEVEKRLPRLRRPVVAIGERRSATHYGSEFRPNRAPGSSGDAVKRRLTEIDDHALATDNDALRPVAILCQAGVAKLEP